MTNAAASSAAILSRRLRRKKPRKPYPSEIDSVACGGLSICRIPQELCGAGVTLGDGSADLGTNNGVEVSPREAVVGIAIPW